MRKIRFASVYLLVLSFILLAVGGYTEWHYVQDIAVSESLDGDLKPYREFLHLVFFFLGFLTLCSIYFLEKREATILQKEMDERERIEAERVRLIDELQEALAEVKTLSGMLPICASCKKIRDDGGYWNQLEAYISDRSEAEFSHGICPDCAKELYPGYYDEDEDREPSQDPVKEPSEDKDPKPSGMDEDIPTGGEPHA